MEVYKQITEEQLQSIVKHQARGSISIISSCRDNRTASEYHRIQLKNFSKDCFASLTTQGHSSEEAKELLKPLNKMLDVSRHWNFSSQTIALFLCTNFSMGFELPRPMASRFIINNHFYVKPLFALIEEPLRYHVLSLSQGEVKLFRASQSDWQKIELPTLPENIDEVYEEFDFERSLQFRTDTPSERGLRGARFHGHGGAGDEAKLKSQFYDYLDRIDQAVCAELNEGNSHLVIAAVHHIAKLFQERSACQYMVPEFIKGSASVLGEGELRAQAAEIMRRFSIEQKRERFEELQRLRSSALCSVSPQEVVRAAAQGAVESLFVKVDSTLWGEFDPQTFQVEIHESKQASSEDLINEAAIKTFQTEGRVVPIFDDEQIMENDEVSAIFRYPVAAPS